MARPSPSIGPPQHANAILEAWYPGEEGGTAIAETLAGDTNPAGRLPLTFYASLDQLPPFADYSMKNRTYRYFTGKPLYTFGYGLSYTTFTYSDLKAPQQVQAGEPVQVEAEVRNTGSVAGDEVVELYLTQPRGFETPIRELAAFTRVHLDAGAHRPHRPHAPSRAPSPGRRARQPRHPSRRLHHLHRRGPSRRLRLTPKPPPSPSPARRSFRNEANDPRPGRPEPAHEENPST